MLSSQGIGAPLACLPSITSTHLNHEIMPNRYLALEALLGFAGTRALDLRHRLRIVTQALQQRIILQDAKSLHQRRRLARLIHTPPACRQPLRRVMWQFGSLIGTTPILNASVPCLISVQRQHLPKHREEGDCLLIDMHLHARHERAVLGKGGTHCSCNRSASPLTMSADRAGKQAIRRGTSDVGCVSKRQHCRMGTQTPASCRKH